MFNKKLLNCEPIDLSRFVFDLRDRHLEFWTLFSDGHESATAKRLLITSGAHCLHKELWLPILLTGFPGTCFLNFQDVAQSQCGSVQTSCPHPLRWNRNFSPQEVHVLIFIPRCLRLAARKTTSSIFFCFMNRRTVILLLELKPCSLCKIELLQKEKDVFNRLIVDWWLSL